ncbi:DNA polymerase IV [Candidatus Uhrbacteria bacterium]|nr:DNA polymerase IV [Candidatus Uhrbacteria bacterium]
MSLKLSTSLIAHVDMNSYFASVEQQANPTLRGRPLGVCAYLHKKGCVIAASIEAKRLGMKVGMSVEEAKLKVPSAVFVQNDPPKYRAVTSRVFSILHELTDCVEHYSIDEAFLDLTGWYRDPAEAAWALIRARWRIRDEVGDWLRCSIGIAPTRFLAKTASDLEKPNGLVVIDKDNLDEILSKLDLEDVCGIGPRIRRRLEKIGIRTLLELKKYPVGNLMRAFGKNGFYLWSKVNGFEVENVTPFDGAPAPKSVGHSYCVPDRVNKEGKVLATLIKLTERAGRRMRALDLLAGSIYVSVGLRQDYGFRSQFDSVHDAFWRPGAGEGGTLYTLFEEPASDSFSLVGAATELLRELWHGECVNFLAVTLTNLAPPSGQRRLSNVGARHASPLPWDRRTDRKRLASTAADQIRDRYGDEAIMFGQMLGLGDEAPDRIGFRKVEGVEIQ